ncbi:MAG: SMP-30/gluconolactonase/LRE family protein [Rhizobiaceae bacterium]
MRRFLAVMAVMCSGLASAQAAEIWRTVGFQAPESVIVDRERQRLIVSNVNGAPDAADGNGFLSLLTPDGKLAEAQWVTGMDAPKGMALVGGKLYVADIKRVHIVDIVTGKIEQTVVPEGAVFLNDVAADEEGIVYVSDTGGNAIFRVNGETAEIWLKDEALNAPNGLLIDGQRLLVVSWGGDKKGSLLAVDIASKSASSVAAEIGNLDGLAKVGDTLFFTDFMGGKLFKFTGGASPEVAIGVKIGAADIGTDGKTIFVPMMNDGEVVAITPD